MRKLIRKVVRASAAAAAQLAVVGAVVGWSVTPVAAQSVSGEMNSFFNRAGGAANVTGPSAYNGQSAGYYSGGSVWTRFPNKTVSPFNLQLPSARAGCGGIDLFGGSFSFINTDEIIATFKATANNAIGYAFQLAIDSISAEIGNVMKDMTHRIQALNQFSMNSCEMAQAAVNTIGTKMDLTRNSVCQQLAIKEGKGPDSAWARHKCGNAGGNEEILNDTTDPQADPAKSRNYTWHALMSQRTSPDSEYADLLMTMIGTIIYVAPTEKDGEPKMDFRPPASWDLYTALLDGSAASGGGNKVLTCNDGTGKDQCLAVGDRDFDVSAANSYKGRVTALITSMAQKVRTNEKLTATEISLLGMASIPLYKILVVNEAAAFRVSDSDMAIMSEVVAVDVLTTHIERMLDEIQRAQTGAQVVEHPDYAEWRQRVQEVRVQLNAKKQGMSEKFSSTMHLIERTQMLEKTLKNAMSPQMTASLRFGRGLSAQGIR